MKNAYDLARFLFWAALACAGLLGLALVALYIQTARLNGLQAWVDQQRQPALALPAPSTNHHANP